MLTNPDGHQRSYEHCRWLVQILRENLYVVHYLNLTNRLTANIRKSGIENVESGKETYDIISFYK